MAQALAQTLAHLAKPIDQAVKTLVKSFSKSENSKVAVLE